MKSRILLSLSLFAAIISFAQVRPVQGKQFEPATAEGQILMSGSNLKGSWQTSPFLKWADTVATIATLHDLGQVDGKTLISGTFSGGTITLTRANGTSFTVGINGEYIPLAQKGANSGVAPLNASGKIDPTYLPAQSVSDVFTVNSQAAMLALSTATQGDYAIRTDQSKTYILNGSDPSVLGNWVELPAATGIVTLNGKSGSTVTINTDDVGEGVTNKYYTDARARTAISGTGAISYNNATGAISLTSSGVTSGTYNTVTVGTDGRVNSASNTAYLTATDLVPYYTKTNLQTGGQAQVHWSNITNVPTSVALSFEMQENSGSTSSTITLNNTPKFGNATPVYFNGVLLHAADYSISGNTLTLGTPRTSSDVIRIMNFY